MYFLHKAVQRSVLLYISIYIVLCVSVSCDCEAKSRLSIRYMAYTVFTVKTCDIYLFNNNNKNLE